MTTFTKADPSCKLIMVDGRELPVTYGVASKIYQCLQGNEEYLDLDLVKRQVQLDFALQVKEVQFPKSKRHGRN